MTKLKCDDKGYHDAVDQLKETLLKTQVLGSNIQIVRVGQVGSQAALVFGEEEPEHYLPISDLEPDAIRVLADNFYALAEAMEGVQEAERTGDDALIKKYFFENTEPPDTLAQTVH